MKLKLLLFLAMTTCGSIPAANFFWKPDYAALNYDWADTSNWVTTSGGSIHPGSIPGPADNVIVDPGCIDARIDLYDTARCHSILFTAGLSYASLSPLLSDQTGGASPLLVYGSFQTCPDLGLVCNIVFMSAGPSNTIDLHITGSFWGDPLDILTVSFKGTGTWTLLSPLDANYISMERGRFFTADQPVRTHNFQVPGTAFRSLMLGTSVVEVIDAGGGFEVTGSNHYIDADSASIILTAGDNVALVFNGGVNQHYHYVELDTLAPTPGMLGINCEVDKLVSYGTFQEFTMSGRIHKAEFYAGGMIANTTSGERLSYDTLLLENILSPGFGSNSDYTFDCDTLTVGDVLQINSGPADTISITEYWGSSANYLLLPDDSLCLDYLKLRNVHALGSGVYFAGSNSADLGNNSGWLFSGCDIATATASSSFFQSGPGVYPNPFSSEISVRSNGNKLLRAEVFTMAGEELISSENLDTQSEVSLHLTAIASGCYVLKVTTEAGVKHQIIIKQ
ncbi:MAG: hypothetical protein JWO09_2693 [Bacteroidetes bacterium]|nr:hypothetical protein [Bacteroidota bacterium]